MVINDLEKDIKIKCIEEGMTQASLANKIGKKSQYINHIVKNNDGVVNKTFLQIMEGLGYDVELVYVKREVNNHE